MIRETALFVRSVGNLQTTNALALDDNFAVPRAQFDLANVTADGVNLAHDYRRVRLGASR